MGDESAIKNKIADNKGFLPDIKQYKKRKLSQGSPSNKSTLKPISINKAPNEPFFRA